MSHIPMAKLETADHIGPLNKGLGPLERAVTPGEAAALGWNLLREDLSLPAAVLYRDRLLNNQEWMRRFIEAYGVKLAPHGKTTMAPKLFAMQLQGGAWGITLATAHQARVAYQHGVRRILMANQLVGMQNMAAVSQLLRDPDVAFYCLVDSAEGVEMLGQYFAPLNLTVPVLIELGVMGGRAGVRDDVQLAAVLDALERWRNTVRLCGVEVYEGVLPDEDSIRAFLRRACQVTARLLAEKKFAQAPASLSKLCCGPDVTSPTMWARTAKRTSA